MALLSDDLPAPNLTRVRIRPQGCGPGALLDRFGVFVQALLALVAFSTLMLKRFKEPKEERRSWRIWFYDTSKQAIGALFIHFANVFLSDLTESDPCSLYLMNFILDATLGMLLIWLGVKTVSWIMARCQWTYLVFGEYGDPPQAAAWVAQGFLYLLIMTFEKTAVGLVLLIPGWTKAVMFWVVDSLTMKKPKEKERVEIRVTEYSEALKDDDIQVLLCPTLDFDSSRSDVDLLASLPEKKTNFT
ncbi:store-operated calcium entry regulator STIMATE-like isoform X2 [Erythrolamprus reginae]|uniref:store-operated calcium entry regulator STIMATE-like isoform X2 n=1 Tax=Erythrolamprus reginae TaxID=121349 RepID=UPI00396CFFE9